MFSKLKKLPVLSVVMAAAMFSAGPSFALTNTEPDIIVANLNDKTVSRIVNVTGTDFLRLPSEIPAGVEPAYVVPGDFNSDGLKDLIVVNPADELVFMLGLGNGSFNRLTNSISFGFQISQTAVGDFNNDGLLDFVVSFNGPSVQVWLAKNDGGLAADPNTHFTAQPPVAIGSRANALAAADFNKDGKLDAVVCDYNAGNVVVLNGSGTGLLTYQLTLSAGLQPEDVRVGDFNADGKPDFAVAGGNTQYVSVYLGNGNGTFAPELKVTTRSGGDGTYALAVGDINNDGYDDIVTRGGSPAGGPTLDVLLWDAANANFAQSIPPIPIPNVFLSGITVVDMNGDGNRDVIFPNAPVNNTLSIYYGDGTGNLGSPKILDTGAFPNSVAVVDIDPSPESIVTKIGFSNNVQGPRGMTKFEKDKTLYIFAEHVGLDTKAEPDTKVIANLTQTMANGTEINQKVKLVEGPRNFFTGSVKLDSFSFGKVEVVVKGVIRNNLQNPIVIFNHKSEITVMPDFKKGLVTYYSFNQAPVNGRISDESTVGNKATVSPSTEFLPSSGITGGAFHFRGTDTSPVDFIAGDGIGSLRHGTISFWMKSEAVEAARGPFSSTDPGACGNVCPRFEQNNNGQLVVNPLQFGQPGIYSPIVVNQWHHIVLTFDDATSQAKGYLDGQLKFTVPVNLVAPQTPFNFSPYLGRGSFSISPNSFYKGLLDEVRIYNRPLSDQEVAALFDYK